MSLLIVSIKAELDANALKDFNDFTQLRLTEDFASIEKLLLNEYQCPSFNTSKPSVWSYATHIFGILLEIDKELEKETDFPISVKDTKKVHTGIRKCIEYGLKPYILGVSIPIDIRLPFIVTSTKVVLKLTKNKFFPLFCARTDQHLVYTDLLSSIFTIICSTSDELKSYFDEQLIKVQTKLSHTDFFKILFLIMGSSKNPFGSVIQKAVHVQLKKTLYRSGSFKALCEALLPSVTSLDQDEEIIKKRLHSSATISSIVAEKGHPVRFYHQCIEEIYQHLLNYIRNNKSNQLNFVDVGVRCLSKLSSLHLKHIERHLLDIFFKSFNQLMSPSDLMAGAIVCQSNEFLEIVRLIYLTFCAMGPSDNTMPSEFLISYMPMFFQIHRILTESKNTQLKNEVLSIIVRCLSNRNEVELNQIIEWVLYEDYSKNVKYLHPRLNIEHCQTDKEESLSFSVAVFDEKEDGLSMDVSKFFEPANSLVNVLKNSNHNMLTYSVFVQLLRIFSATSNISRTVSWSNELLQSETELKKAIETKFKRKYATIHALNELILFKPFHGQFVENPQIIVSLLDKMIHQQIDQLRTNKIKSNQLDEIEEMLVIILLCTEEFLIRITDSELKSQLEKTLGELKTQLQIAQTESDGILSMALKKLDMLLNPNIKWIENSKFNVYKTILTETSSEPYTIVYGIVNIIKLIETKDEETYSNAHVILVLAMKLLKDEDSYVFLNCIKLLIALFDILEDTVLETLISEYHFHVDVNDSTDVDFKLKVGETIVKVVQGLGGMCYKFKGMLINCFLKGICNQNDEFRTSNVSNLGVVMRLLSYQIHHFFEEVSMCINIIYK